MDNRSTDVHKLLFDALFTHLFKCHQDRKKKSVLVVQYIIKIDHRIQKFMQAAFVFVSVDEKKCRFR